MPKNPTVAFVKDIRKNCKTVDEAVTKVLDACRIQTYPIDIDLVARSMGITIFAAHFKDDDLRGILVDTDTPLPPYNKKLFIAVNGTDYLTRKRFTVAHEIGHYLLNCDESLNYYERSWHESTRAADPTERAADFFAASLLMPTVMTKACFLELKKEDSLSDQELMTRVIPELAMRFEVSEKVALQRLAELGIINIKLASL